MTAALVPLVSLIAGALASGALWDAWPDQRFVRRPAPCLRHGDLVERLMALEAAHHGRVRIEAVGRSVEGRTNHLLSLGRGPRRVLLWSQMHGDEPSATPALLDLAHILLSRRDAWAQEVLERTTLLMVPMLNPDGAERYQRRNAQGIDVNRDALSLATPEGRLLKTLRDRHRPDVGFNLHDQDPRTSVGDTGRPATVSLLAVAGDAQVSLTPGRARTRRLCAAIATALAPLVPGRVARYDEDWNPRAFGDNLTAWGTPVVLIETGGRLPGEPIETATRAQFVALAVALSALARDDAAGHDPAAYEGLPRNRRGGYADFVLQGGRVFRPGAGEYRADVAFDVFTGDRVAAGCAPGPPGPSAIAEVGDARVLGAGRRVDVSGAWVVPGLAVSVHGGRARDWLTADGIESLAGLGVVEVRWHVREDERAGADTTARAAEGPGRPAVEVVVGAAPAAWLRVEAPPLAPRSRALGDVLDALTAGAWRVRAGPRSLGELYGLLAGEGPDRPAVLAPGSRASFLVVRVGDEGLDAQRTQLESVWIDGREVSRQP